MIDNRIQNTFKNLKKNKKKALITFVTGCDPNYETSKKVLNELNLNDPLLDIAKNIWPNHPIALDKLSNAIIKAILCSPHQFLYFLVTN